MKKPPNGMELWVSGTGQHLIVHAKEKCSGMCTIHSPVTDHMSEFPTHWREDRSLMERICPHGVGHPDSSQLAYSRMLRGEEYTSTESIHGCCEEWCCVSTDERVTNDDM